MPLILIEGFESDVSSWSVPVGSPVTYVAGRNGMAIQASSIQLDYVIPVLAQQTDTLTMGVAYRFPTIAVGGTPLTLFAFGTVDAGVPHCGVRLSATGALEFCRNPTSVAVVLGSPSAAVILPNQWHYIEMQAKLHDTTGFGIVRVDGVEVINVTSVDTKQAGTKTVFDNFTIRVPVGNTLIDDVYVMSGAGDAFLGDCRVETLYPSGNGTTNQFTGSDGESVDNYLLVDESGVPSVADYVLSSVAGQQDLYAFGDLGATSQAVLGVQPIFHIAKTDTSARAFRPLVRRGVTTVGPVTQLDTAYRNYNIAYPTDPETGSAWTIANVNALQAGVQTV